MEGQEGLAGLEEIGQIADALLAFQQAINDLQARFIAKRMEPLRGALSRNVRGHTSHYINET
jgi:hypothetical protein